MISSSSPHEVKSSRSNSCTGNLSSVSALFSSDTKITCTYCRGPHPSMKCSVVTDVVARKSVSRRQGRCFIRLRKYHLARDCSSSKRCFRCHGNHHTSVCEHETSHPQPPETDTSTYNAIPVRSENRESTTMFVDTKTSVLLQTATAWVSQVNIPDQRIKARIIFDTRSQRSYISSKLRESLNLPTTKTETLMIKIFG